MNRKRSHQKESSLQPKKKVTSAKSNQQLKSQKMPKGDRLQERLANSNQVNSLPKILGFFKQDSSCHHFHRGFFWGGLVSLTAILSAIGGVALTQIDLVEQQISQRILGNSSADLAAVTEPSLTTPLQVLLVEIELETDSLVGFSKATKGRSKNFLLLKVDPQFRTVQAINIPLNTKARIPGFGQGTVKDAYQLGGIDLLSQVITQLPGNLQVDRYLRTTPGVFQELTASGKITLENCDSRIEDCFDKKAQVLRQQDAFETIRQRVNIPNYLTNFEKAIARVEPQLDTNLSTAEIISLANFVKELEPEEIRVDLLPGYVPGQAIKSNQPEKFAQKSLTIAQDSILAKNRRFQNQSVAVQNTTDSPELARRVIAYLKQRNFRHVYLVEQIPLKLEQTKIVSNYSQVETANYLKNVLGFGSLEATSASQPPELVLQLGKDAWDLPGLPNTARQPLNLR